MPPSAVNGAVAWVARLVGRTCGHPDGSRSPDVAETLHAALAMATPAGIARIADIGGLDNAPFSVVSVVRPAARSICLSSGKGLTLLEACVSGLMEALELHHAEIFDDWRRMDEVPGDMLIPALSSYPKIARSKIAEGEAGNVRMAIGDCLRTGRAAAVPFDLVHVDLRTNSPFLRDGYVVSSNGLGAGRSLKEAVVHGLCEIIEGDAVALFQASGRRMGNAVRVDQFQDQAMATIVATLKARGIEVALRDITTDIGVPAYYCGVTETGRSPTRLPGSADGTGCHPNPVIAMRRALMEALQTRVLLISGARDDITPSSYATEHPLTRVQEQPAVLDHAVSSRGSNGGGVEWIVERLEQAGFANPIAVNLAPRATKLAFVRVVVPGLEAYPFARGYNPGPRARAMIRG